MSVFDTYFKGSRLIPIEVKTLQLAIRFLQGKRKIERCICDSANFVPVIT